MSGLIWVQTVLHSNQILEKPFKKNFDSEKYQTERTHCSKTMHPGSLLYNPFPIPSHSINGHKWKIFNRVSWLIEMLWDCSDNVRKMFYIKFMFVHSLTTFLLSLSDILYVTFLASNEVNYIWRSTCKIIADTETSRCVVLRNEFDSTILEQC